MPIRTLVGPNVATLLKQAQQVIGADAVILHVRRVRTSNGTLFEVAASDPATAAGLVVLVPTLNVEPDANLDSVNYIHTPTVTLSHEEVGGAGAVVDDARALAASPLLGAPGPAVR